MSRSTTIERNTTETQIRATVNLDGTGRAHIETPVPFLTHMLEQLPRHGGFDLELHAAGDVAIDGHHTTEDVGIVLGRCFLQALGDRRGIRRYGSATLPMDEALVRVALDLSGRAYFVWRMDLPAAKLGDFDTELAEVFFEAFARSAQINLHVHKLEGRNLHHLIEIAFKALARSLAEACSLVPGSSVLPSTKGHLD